MNSVISTVPPSFGGVARPTSCGESHIVSFARTYSFLDCGSTCTSNVLCRPITSFQPLITAYTSLVFTVLRWTNTRITVRTHSHARYPEPASPQNNTPGKATCSTCARTCHDIRSPARIYPKPRAHSANYSLYTVMLVRVLLVANVSFMISSTL